MKNPTLYIFINKSLNMSSGKIASQAAHAAAMSMARNHIEDNDMWDQAIHKTIIVLEARDEAHMRNIKDYLKQRDIESDFVIDEGVNEIPTHTITALATVFMDKTPEADQLMSTFKLYRDEPSELDNMVTFIKGLGNL